MGQVKGLLLWQMELECVTIIPARNYLSFCLSNDHSFWMSKDEEIIARVIPWGPSQGNNFFFFFFGGALYNFVIRHSAEYCMINEAFFVCFSHFFSSLYLIIARYLFYLWSKLYPDQKKASIKFLTLSSLNLMTLITFNFLFWKSVLLCVLPIFFPIFFLYLLCTFTLSPSPSLKCCFLGYEICQFSCHFVIFTSSVSIVNLVWSLEACNTKSVKSTMSARKRLQ